MPPYLSASIVERPMLNIIPMFGLSQSNISQGETQALFKRITETMADSKSVAAKIESDLKFAGA